MKKKLNQTKKSAASPKKCAKGQPNIMSMFHKQADKQANLANSRSEMTDSGSVAATSGLVSSSHSSIGGCSSGATTEGNKRSRLSLKRKLRDDSVEFSGTDSCASCDDSAKGFLTDQLLTSKTGCDSSSDKYISKSLGDHSDSVITSLNCVEDKISSTKPQTHRKYSNNNIMESVISSKIDQPECSKISDTAVDNQKRDYATLDDHTADSFNDEPRDDPEEPLYKVPYYLENFLLILDTVLKDEYYCSLFDEQDQLHITTFQSLSECSQKLYVRLIQRQHRWLTLQKIRYPRIADDLTPILDDLVNTGLLLNAKGMTDLHEVLVALAAPDIKTLAKTLKLSTVTGQKDDIVAAILQHSRRGGISAFFGAGGGNKATSNMIMKRAKELLGPCYKLHVGCRSVFMRVMMLFGLHRTRGDDDEGPGGQQQIFQMLLSSLGRIKYPEFTVGRESKIFKDRDNFLRFAAALQLETDMTEALEVKRYSEAESIYKTVLPMWTDWIQDPDTVQHDRSLRDYLRAYTAGAVYTRILSQAVELLQYQRQYGEAVQLLEQLLLQDVYHIQYRGRWYDRLALNLDHHLKKHNKALDMIQKALCDDCVRTGHRLSLYQRAHKLCHAAGSNKYIKARWVEFEADRYSDVQEAPKVVIQGTRLTCGQQGPLYISNDGDDVTLLTRVEDVALAHYEEQGYSEGIHGEGSTLTCLFALYMWDIIFTDGVPDTFYNPFQILPLDWGSDHFYSSRQKAIDDRLGEIQSASSEILEEMLEESWIKHEDTLCIGLNWDRFKDMDHAKGFVRCVGSKALAEIMRRLAHNMRYCTGGVPDLAVWNPDTGLFKMVEVKGPGDRLSTKQILWLDYLLQLGVSAEVCHVQAVSSKKLRT